MPGPIIRRPQDMGGVAGWMARKADPANESVTDSTLTNVVQLLARALGADDPASQLMGIMTTGVPSAGKAGGLVGAIQRRLHPSGFYSRVDEAVDVIPDKGVPAPALLNRMKKAPGGVASEEIDYRKLAELVSSKGNQPITRAELKAWLDAHPAPFPEVKTLGGNVTKPAFVNRHTGDITGWVDEPVGEHAREALFQSGIEIRQVPLDDAVGANAPTKFSQYQVPGGENYRETLNTLPSTKRALTAAEREEMTGLGLLGKLSKAQKARYDELNRIEMAPTTDFRSSHFDEPNILVHTRANERTLPTGERGRFLEEVQSDWHQAGKERGYRSDKERQLADLLAKRDTTPVEPRLAQLQEITEQIYRAQNGDRFATPPRHLVERYNEIKAELDSLYPPVPGRTTRDPRTLIQEQIDALGSQDPGVPDAPFKETWPDLGLKQQLIETANDPQASFLALSSPETQINRWGTERVRWEPAGRVGFAQKPAWKVSFEEQVGGNALAGQGIADMGAEAEARGLAHTKTHTVTDLRELEMVMGDETKAAKAWKRMQATPQGGEYLPRAEGFRKNYGEKYPSAIEKALKPFGGTVERGSITAGVGRPTQYANFDAAMAAQAAGPTQEPAWIARLSPQMKERIKREGLPLLAAIAMLKDTIQPEPSHEVSKGPFK